MIDIYVGEEDGRSQVHMKDSSQLAGSREWDFVCHMCYLEPECIWGMVPRQVLKLWVSYSFMPSASFRSPIHTLNMIDLRSDV